MSAVVEMPPEPRRNRAVAVAANVDIVQAALKSGNVEIYSQAVALFKELEGMAARKAFDNAMADAKAEIPVIRKNRRVQFDSRKAGASSTDYRHEDMAEIARTVDPILSKFGLSYRFRVSSKINEPVSVTCVLSHRDGHFEETELSAGRDDSGNKNHIQQVGSTVTYLQRYTLKAALGLAAAADDDGQSSQQEADEAYTPPAGSITQQQVDFIREALEAKGAAATAFLQWANCKGMFAGRKQRLEELPAQHYAASVNAIAQFKKA